MPKTFYAQISERVATYEKRLEAVFKASAQDVAEQITRPVSNGGQMHVRTGFLRASLMASTSAMPLIDRDARPSSDAAEGSYTPNDTDVILAIAGATLGDTIFLGFTASYAGYREALDGFVAMAAQRWQQTVDSNVRKAVRAIP